MNKHVHIEIVVCCLRRWIDSCETIKQLETCERLVDDWIRCRPHNPTLMEVLQQSLQVQRLLIQLFTPFKTKMI